MNPIIACDRVRDRLVITVACQGAAFASKTARCWRSDESNTEESYETHVYPCDSDGKPFMYAECDFDWMCLGRITVRDRADALATHERTVRSFEALWAWPRCVRKKVAFGSKGEGAA